MDVEYHSLSMISWVNSIDLWCLCLCVCVYCTGFGRELKAYERKIKKARAKRNEHLADRLESNRPSYTLDHLVKERWIPFLIADCLEVGACMLRRVGCT